MHVADSKIVRLD